MSVRVILLDDFGRLIYNDLQIREYKIIKFSIYDINDVDIFRNVNVNSYSVSFNMRFRKRIIKINVNIIS